MILFSSYIINYMAKRLIPLFCATAAKVSTMNLWGGMVKPGANLCKRASITWLTNLWLFANVTNTSFAELAHLSSLSCNCLHFKCKLYPISHLCQCHFLGGQIYDQQAVLLVAFFHHLRSFQYFIDTLQEEGSIIVGKLNHCI